MQRALPRENDINGKAENTPYINLFALSMFPDYCWWCRRGNVSLRLNFASRAESLLENCLYQHGNEEKAPSFVSEQPGSEMRQ